MKKMLCYSFEHGDERNFRGIFLSRLKGIDRGYKLIVLLSRRDAIVNLATVEFSFGAVVLTEK